MRQNKVARMIQKELADIFRRESHNLFGGKMISVTVVRITPDFGLAKIYLSIFPSDNKDEFMNVLHEHVKKLRLELGNRIRHQLRIIPELVFYIDDSLDYVENIERLLKK